MRNRRTTIITSTVLAVSAAAAVAGVSIAAGSGGSPAYSASGSGSGSGSTAVSSSAAVVHTATASVQGTKERILVDAKGDPLYTYKPDTATKSFVSGQLAVLWPPLVAATAKPQGGAGNLTTVNTGNGRQVAYRGHFLYTFVQDQPGQVTGQGVQNFFVATPDMAQNASSSTSGSAPAPAPAGGGGGGW
jgi:predicted lipoprotein with Yx(FWY)xxD motif